MGLLLAGTSSVAAPADEAVQIVINLLRDPDKEIRALAFDQIRSEVKGPEATRQFAAELPKLDPAIQAGLLSALADRGDTEARPAVLEILNAPGEEPVKLAAIEALGALGRSADVPLLAARLGADSEAERRAARASLTQLRGDDIAAAIRAQLRQAPAPIRLALIEVLVTRRAREAMPELLAAAIDDDPKVRAAAMVALGELAGPEQIPGMVQGVLKAEPGPQRDAAERALVAVCQRIDREDERAEPLLAAIGSLSAADQTAMLPALGRIGTGAARKIIEEALADADLKRHEAGLRAVCNWPDASIAPRLIELAKADPHANHRAMALKALIRVAPLPDRRSEQQRLELLKTVLAMCRRDDERNLVLRRASAIRTIETLRFVVPFLDQPSSAEAAAESVVELAHHRALRQPNRAEFERALDKVIQISRDATVVERAQRYKKDQTWVRPAVPKPR